MKINSKSFQVREGHEVDLKKWPTKVDPVYKSKEQYKKILDEHVAQLSSQQELLYASNRYAVLLITEDRVCIRLGKVQGHHDCGANLMRRSMPFDRARFALAYCLDSLRLFPSGL